MNVFDKEELKPYLKNLLNDHIVTVTFVKKDGSERTMKCTLMESKIPKESLPKNSGRVKNDDVQAVFDVSLNEWRSFRYDSVKEVSFTLE